MSFSEKLEIGRKVVVILGPLAVAIWTVLTYFAAQKSELTAKQHQFDQSLEARKNELQRSREEREKELTTLQWEARRPFLTRQMELCFEAVAMASTLATAADRAKWEKARGRFWELYWGELALVENGPVAREMVKFGKKLKQEGANDLPIENLEQPSLQIARQCRALIGASWKVELPETSR